MTSLEYYIDGQLSKGRGYFLQKEAMAILSLSAKSFVASANRLRKKQKLISPRRGFYLILRPEDRIAGVPDPVRWIDPLMRYLKLDYRISLLRAAAFHGASHQAAMVFQVIVPKQLHPITIGRHQLNFIYQAPEAFLVSNAPDYMEQIKSESGFAKVAGVELTLLDCVRYFHKATGINGVAQIVQDISSNVDQLKLTKIAIAYENSIVRRLGYLLELTKHTSQAKALEPLALKAKSMKLLDPSSKPLMKERYEKNRKWMLEINEPVEIDF